ncbi:FAD-binding oxidoreductase [Clostridium perfringens]|nr:FAD-binding oxidoreductase [Clostridium perfringens]
MEKVDFSKLTGDLVTRENIEYEKSIESWNRAIKKYPLGIVFCNNIDDVKNALEWAKENNIPFRIRVGRHNYEGYSIGNDVLVIDLSKMNNIIIDEENMKVTIEGGVKNEEIYEALGVLGYPFPGGGCPTVGVVGFALGGGWGYSSRLLGLGCDNLLEVKFINSKGKIVIANEYDNSDLFWATKGCGGGNFGVVISMTFKIPQKIEMATLIDIDYPNAEKEELVYVIRTLQKKFKNLDRRMNLKTAIYNSKDKGIGVKITGLFYGHKEEANEILLPFKLPTRVNFNLSYMRVLEANRKIEYSHPPYEKYKSTGRFVFRDYDNSEIEKLIDIVSNRAEGAYYTAISFYGLGGAVKDVHKNSSAFYYRDARFIMGIQSVWEDDIFAEENIKWIKNNFKYIESITTGSFINFPFKDLKDYEEEYYGENKDKLREIRKKYDENRFFAFEQGIK